MMGVLFIIGFACHLSQSNGHILRLGKLNNMNGNHIIDIGGYLDNGVQYVVHMVGIGMVE